MQTKSTRVLVRSLHGINELEAKRRLSILKERKEDVIKIVTTNKKKEARKQLITLFDLDLGSLSLEEAADRITSFSDFLYPTSYSRRPDLTEKRTLEVIDVLGDNTEVCEKFMRKKHGPYSGRKQELAPRGEFTYTGDLVDVEIELDTVEVLPGVIVSPVADTKDATTEPELVAVPLAPTEASPDLVSIEKEMLLSIINADPQDAAILRAGLRQYPLTQEGTAVLHSDLLSYKPLAAFLNFLRRKGLK
jgi:hypothetical protein